MERPRPWFALDNAFLTRASIESLADNFGPAGPLAIIALVCEASSAIRDFGLLDWHYPCLAKRIRTDTETAKAIIHAAVGLGLVKVVSEDGDEFKLRLLRWSEWHPKDPTAAARKRRSRERQREGLPDA
jgi:hypothetical protein